MKVYKILICDDNASIHASLSDYLKAENFEVASVYDGESALRAFENGGIDLIILDVMLPRMFGINVCREIRKTSRVPIIILSAKGDESDRIIGLESGANDYVSKPFSPREVALRVKNLLDYASFEPEETILRCGELLVKPDSYEVYVGGSQIMLTPRETEVLTYFMRNIGKVLSREQILNAVWGYNYYGDTRAVDTQVKRIRQKLPAEDVSYAFRSVYGVGYKLEAAKG